MNSLKLAESFNRTFMELKSKYNRVKASLKSVLIVPLWN